MGKLSIQPEQVVMISAGAAGIDRAIAETFLARDYHVHVCPRCCFRTAGRPQLSASGPLWRACLPVEQVQADVAAVGGSGEEPEFRGVHRRTRIANGSAA